MSEFTSGPNERIEPPVKSSPIHLHTRSGSGVVSKKDPTPALNGGNQYIYNSPGLSLLPPPMLDPVLPIIPPFTPAVPIDPGQPVPPFPPDPGAPFPYAYYGGKWFAAVQFDFATGVILEEPYWYPFAPIDETPVENGANLRFNTADGNVEYWDGADWVSWSTLPTVNPGGGGIWLSAT